MKVTLLLGLPMLASAAVLEARQSRSPIVLKDMKPSENRPRIVPSAQRTLTRYGRKFACKTTIESFILTICSAFVIAGSAVCGTVV
jgi:hypothetical protein